MLRAPVGTLMLLALGTAGAAVGLAPSGAVRPQSVHVTSSVTVVAKEFSFTLSRRSAPVGKVIFTVVNRGKVGHNFRIAGKKTPLIQPGKAARLLIVFRKEGNYKYLCTVPGHARLGMKGVLKVGRTAARPTYRVSVVAKEFKFTLSRRTVPLGTVIFTVVNRGKIGHDFKIRGEKTRLIQPGGKAKLTVVFARAGRYTYICTVPGHARLGMKGVLGAGPSTLATTTTTTTATTATSTVPVGNATTTVTVGMLEYRFVLSQSTVPSGRVTFVITNNGSQPHNFDIGVRAGQILAPGQSETWTVALPPRAYEYVCDVPFHADYGMVGQFTVTP